MSRHGGCNLRYRIFLCHPAVLKLHWLSSVCLRYRPAPCAFISCTAELPLSERPRELLAYADCVFVLPAALSWAQTAPAELEHINHSRCHRCQLNYKDTQFLLRLIMCRLSQRNSTGRLLALAPPICLTTGKAAQMLPCFLLLKGGGEVTVLFTFN